MRHTAAVTPEASMRKLLLTAALALCGADNAVAGDGWPAGVLSAPTGRYVFGQINQMARDQYMLDTQTGRLWRIMCAESDPADATKCLGTILAPVGYGGPGKATVYTAAEAWPTHK